MKNNWQLKKLGEVCEVVTGTTPPKSDMTNYGNEIPFFKPPHLWDNLIHTTEEKLSLNGAKKARVVPPNTVLVTCIGNLGRTGFVKREAAFNQQINAILENEKLIGKYLFYQAQSPSFRNQLERLATGTTVSIVNKKNFETIEIPVPPLETQHAIVSKIEELFSELDQGIADLKTAQAQLKVYRQSVLKHAFEGKLTNKNVKEGELPEGWRIEQLKKISSSIQYGYTESSSKEIIGPKFLRITDIQNNYVDWNEVPFCKITPENTEKYRLKDGDLLFARTGATVGKSFLIKGEIPDSVFASYLIRVRVSEKINDKYLSYFFNSPQYWEQITEGQVGIGQPNVNGTKLGLLNIVLTSLEEQYLIVQEIESRLSVADKMEESIQESLQKAEALRQSILKKAFSGQLL